ncbi:hypothetical protein KCU65_g6605, partial [Aureobasidium melanogenum]
MSTMALPIQGPQGPQAIPAHQKPTLTTLPIDIKHEIFSYLLLGKNVRYSTGGHAPGHSYTFHTHIMRTNKQLYEETYNYLRSHNEFALAHFKYPRLLSGFAPYIAVGKKVKNFRSPAIEITVEDLEPKAQWPHHTSSLNHPSTKVYVQRVLFLSQDLPHFTRQIQLEIHVWPSSQIYVHPPLESRPLQYTPIIVKNDRKIAWKVNPSHRTDLTPEERRARQKRLIAPMAAVFGYGQAIRFPGVDTDIAPPAIQTMTPRLVSIDAVGWDLFENMQAQKRRLHECLISGFGGSYDLLQAYILTAQLAYDAPSWALHARHYNTALLLNTPYRPGMPIHQPLALLSFTPQTLRNTPSDIWMHGVATLGVECFLNAMGLALDIDRWIPLLDPIVTRNLWRMANSPHCSELIRQELLDLVHHYHAWSETFSDVIEGRLDDDHLREAIFDLELGISDDRYNQCVLDDVKCLKEIMRTQQTPTDMEKDFAPGLKRRKRQFIDPLNLVRPTDLHGWTSDAIDNMDAEVKKSIIMHSDAAIKGKTPVPAEKTRSEGHVMLRIVDGTPNTA